MARNEENAALANAKTGSSLEGNLEGSAGSELNSFLPQFANEATAPSGYGPADLAKMKTGAEQTAGGAMSSVVGQGGLMAARTRNQGAFAPALDASAQKADETLSQDTLGVDKANAQLKQQQRQEGLNGMLGVYDTNLAGGINALNSSNGAVNAGTQAATSEQNMWMPFAQDFLGNLKTPTVHGFGLTGGG